MIKTEQPEDVLYGESITVGIVSGFLIVVVYAALMAFVAIYFSLFASAVDSVGSELIRPNPLREFVGILIQGMNNAEGKYLIAYEIGRMSITATGIAGTWYYLRGLYRLRKRDKEAFNRHFNTIKSIPVIGLTIWLVYAGTDAGLTSMEKMPPGVLYGEDLDYLRLWFKILTNTLGSNLPVSVALVVGTALSFLSDFKERWKTRSARTDSTDH